MRMTPDELRIRCAEQKEIKLIHEISEIEGFSEMRIDLDGIPFGFRNGEREEILMYTRSIDAINEAVLRLSDDKIQSFARELMHMNPNLIIDQDFRIQIEDVAFVATASALDRATAFSAIHK